MGVCRFPTVVVMRELVVFVRVFDAGVISVCTGTRRTDDKLRLTGSTVREFAGFPRLSWCGSLLCSHGCLTRELSVFVRARVTREQAGVTREDECVMRVFALFAHGCFDVGASLRHTGA